MWISIIRRLRSAARADSSTGSRTLCFKKPQPEVIRAVVCWEGGPYLLHGAATHRRPGEVLEGQAHEDRARVLALRLYAVPNRQDAGQQVSGAAAAAAGGGPGLRGEMFERRFGPTHPGGAAEGLEAHLEPAALVSSSTAYSCSRDLNRDCSCTWNHWHFGMLQASNIVSYLAVGAAVQGDCGHRACG